MLSLSSSPTILIIIIITIFIFSLHQTTSLSPNTTLSSCHNTTFNCGTITNLSYPFTGGDRPSFCGPPQFHLTCNDGVPEFNISSVSYRVIEIDSVSTLTLARLDLWNETCTHYYVNSTLDGEIFGFGSGNTDLSLFYGCKPVTGLNENSFQCESNGNGNKSDAYTLVGPIPLDPILSTVDCDHYVAVRILESEADRLVQNGSLLREVLMKGFHVNFSSPYEDECSECLRSGGQQCGFDSDHNEPICICGDRLCPSPGSHSTWWNTRLKILIGALGAGFMTTIVLILIVCRHHRIRSMSFGLKMIFRKRRKHVDHNVEAFMESYGSLAPRRYSYSEVKRITNSFAHKLGQGGYGVVYKATLPDGRLAAVKVISESNGSGEDFINEVASISTTSHVNIVSLLGFCYDMNKRALIYEFMPNGSLDNFINGRGGSPNVVSCFDWNTLSKVAIGIARGLDYLHRGCNTRILHLDIKPQNVLLDEDLCPKIADFGLAKICKKKESIISILGTRGTPGYIAPEVFSRAFGGVSHKSDVYSYGMLILEMVGGRKNYDCGGSQSSEMDFPDWIYKDLEQGNICTKYSVITEEEHEMARKMTLVSLWCIQTRPSDRPSMSKVVEMLEGPLQSVVYPPKPIIYSPENLSLQNSDLSSSYLMETISITTQEDGSIELNELSKNVSG